MEKEIIENLCKNLKWHERIIVKLFNKTFIKTYHKARLNAINSILS